MRSVRRLHSPLAQDAAHEEGSNVIRESPRLLTRPLPSSSGGVVVSQTERPSAIHDKAEGRSVCRGGQYRLEGTHQPEV